MSLENLNYPFMGFLTCKNRDCCSLHLRGRGPCALVAQNEGRGVPMVAKNPEEMKNNLKGHKKDAPCIAGTKCELVNKDGDVVRGQDVTLEWEKFPLISRITQQELF